jgi:hypothetical protein
MKCTSLKALAAPAHFYRYFNKVTESLRWCHPICSRLTVRLNFAQTWLRIFFNIFDIIKKTL